MDPTVIDMDQLNGDYLKSLIALKSFDPTKIRLFRSSIDQDLHCTLIHAAVYKGDEECVDLLLDVVSIDDDLGFNLVAHDVSPIKCAIDHNNLTILHKLLRHTRDVNDVDVGNHGSQQSLLYKSVDKGWMDIAQYLISRNADVDIRGSYGSIRITPLMRAVLLGRVKFVKLLVDNGTDPNSQHDPEYLLPIVLEATAKGNIAIMKHLISNGASFNLLIDRELIKEEDSLLCTAICSTNLRTLRFILYSYPDIDLNARVFDGSGSPLHFAVVCNLKNSAVIEELLDAGGDVNKPCESDGLLAIQIRRSSNLTSNKEPLRRKVIQLLAADQVVAQENLDSINMKDYEELCGLSNGGSDYEGNGRC